MAQMSSLTWLLLASLLCPSRVGSSVAGPLAEGYCSDLFTLLLGLPGQRTPDSSFSTWHPYLVGTQ